MNKLYFRRTIFLILKHSKFVFNLFEWITGYTDIRNQKFLYSKDAQKSRSQVIKELKLVRHYWRCGSFHYWRYGLCYRTLTNEEILDYVPTYFHHRKLEQDHAGIDTVYYGDKLSQALLFAERNIPTGEVVAYCAKKKWYSFSSKDAIEIVPTIETLLSDNKTKLFLKPTGGQGGYGIFTIKRVGALYLVNGEEKDLSLFIQSLPNVSFILQRGILQTEQMNNINPDSVNTLRVVVQRNGDKMQMKTCIIRMGRKGKEVDNSAQGGISVNVNIQTGEVASTATSEHGGGVITMHPDTRRLFAGICINNWESVKYQIESIGTKLIDFNNIALDIALTEDGVLLLEFNFRYGIEHQQCVLGGVRRILSIYP